MGRFLGIFFAVAVATLALSSVAAAAQLIDRDAVGLRLSVNAKGEALLTYRKGGLLKHVLVCGPYDGPVLPNVIAACTAPDGTYWAAQQWPQPLSVRSDQGRVSLSARPNRHARTRHR
jgi:hypothetical protein